METTPHFTVQKVGGQFVTVRDGEHPSASCAGWCAAGAMLSMLGLKARGKLGMLMLLAGGGMVYRGTTGKNPLVKLQSMIANLGCCEDGAEGPSFQHDYKTPSAQKPEDLIDEMSMESFPASDAPAHSTPAAPSA